MATSEMPMLRWLSRNSVGIHEPKVNSGQPDVFLVAGRWSNPKILCSSTGTVAPFLALSWEVSVGWAGGTKSMISWKSIPCHACMADPWYLYLPTWHGWFLPVDVGIYTFCPMDSMAFYGLKGTSSNGTTLPGNKIRFLALKMATMMIRVCHNHLKQPLKIGETLHHQGTKPVNL